MVEALLIYALRCCSFAPRTSAFRFAKNDFDSIHARKSIRIDSIRQLGLLCYCKGPRVE